MSIELTYIRSSMKGTHDLCNMRFFIEYILGFTGHGNKKAMLGTMVHKVMEVLAKVKLAHQNNELNPEKWEKYITDEAVGECTTIPQDINLDSIIESVYNYYAKSFDHAWTEKDFKEVKLWCYKTLSYQDGEFDPRKQTIVQPEQHFDRPLEEEWALKPNGEYLRLKGTIDLIVKVDDKTYEIVDYKTGKRINWATGEEKTYEKLMNDFQLRFYHLAACILYPDIETILVTIFFINDGGPFTVSFGKKDIPETVRQIKELYTAIVETTKPRLNRSWKCRFCDQSKSTFEGTNILPILQYKNGIFSKKGDNMSRCEQLEYVFEYKDIDMVISNMSKENFSSATYKAPGEV